MRRLIAVLLVVCLSNSLRAWSYIIAANQTYISQGACFGPTLSVTQQIQTTLLVAGYVPIVNVNESLGCSPYNQSNEFQGSVALVERGVCSFYDKVLYAQNAGAIAVVIFDSIFNESLIYMHPVNDTPEVLALITISSVFVSRASGLALRQGAIDAFAAENKSLSITLMIFPLDCDATTSVFFFRDYSALAIIVAAYMGVSAVYWSCFFVWRRRETFRRIAAMKSLKRVKYSPQTDLAAASTASVNSDIPTRTQTAEARPHSALSFSDAPEPSLSPTSTAPTNAPSSLQEGSGDVEMTDVHEIDLESGGADVATASLDASSAAVVDQIIPDAPLHSKKVSPIRKFVQRHRRRQANQNRQMFDTVHCTVCLEDFTLGEELLFLPCGHIFHPDCVKEWLTSHGQCPVCKANVAPSDQKPGEEYSRTGWGSLFGRPVTQTLVVWFVCFCFIVMLGYFLAAAGVVIS